MCFDNEISEYKKELCESLGKAITVAEKAYISFSESGRDKKEHTASYYRYCAELITASDGATRVTQRISSALQKADSECLPEAVSALGALLEIYISFRGVMEEFLSVCESTVTAKDTPFSARTLVYQTDILIRKVSMMKSDIEKK